MRFRIQLCKERGNAYLPINFQYELSSAIYRIINRADSAFSKFLHGQGYVAFGRQFRLFTFSRVSFSGYRIIKEAGRIEHYGDQAFFEIGFMVVKAAEGFIKGLFMDQEIVIGDRVSRVAYQVSGIVAVQPPVFLEQMAYRCLSPIFIRRKRKEGGEDYLHPEDPEYASLLLQNLVSKSLAYSSALNEGQLEALGTISDFHFKPKGKIYKNGVRIKQMTEKQTHLVGYMYEFELRAPIELHELGYYAGFGHLNSQGFGCVEVKGGEE